MIRSVHTLARALRLVLALLLAPLAALSGGGCYNMSNHERAPYIGDREGAPLVKHLAARIAKSDLKVARSLRVAASYSPPETNELGEWESVGAYLVPLWPYARGEWASPEMSMASIVLEKILAPHFRSEAEEPRSVLIEAGFTEETYRRYTVTVYGLSIYGGISYILGYPIHFGTVSLDAKLHILDYLAARQEDVEIYEGRVHGEETACHGNFLLFFSYNDLASKPFTKGAPAITWDDLFAEAMIDFVNETLLALGDAFPMRCGKCGLDYPASVSACEACATPLARREGTRPPPPRMPEASGGAAKQGGDDE